MSDSFIELTDCRIAYEETGSGEPILFAHGFGLDRNAMRDLSARVGDGFRTILFDWRGHGSTSCPDSDDAYRYSLLRDDLLAFMDELSIERAHFIGHSMGGQVMLMVALARPDRVRSLVTMGAGPCRKVTDPKEATAWERGADFFAKADEEKKVAALAASAPVVDSERTDLDPARLYGHANGANLARMIRGAFLHVEDNGEECKTLKPPTLIIVGDRDTTWLEPSRKLHRLIPGSRLEVIPNAGHLVHLERAEEVAGVIRSFLGR